MSRELLPARLAGRAQRRRGRLRLGLVVAAVTLGSAGAVSLATPAHAVDPVQVTLSIPSVIQLDNSVDDGATQGSIGDFFVEGSIDGAPFTTVDTAIERGLFDPLSGFDNFPITVAPTKAWVINATADKDANTVSTINIKLFDNDNAPNPNDEIDISPAADDRDITFTIDLTTGQLAGDITAPGCIRGAEFQPAALCLDVSLDSPSGDLDGDALPDGWERSGLDVDGDGVATGTADVNLPALGADVNRQDLFVEVDCLVSDANGNNSLAEPGDHSQCPLQGAMTDVAQAFANAPRSNPDGTIGVQLHVDTGTLYGPGTTSVTGGASSSGVTGTVGNLGGGGTIFPEAGNTVVDWDGNTGSPATDFYTLRAAGFNPSRDAVFRYTIFANQVNARQAQNDCTSGWEEGLPGNDVIVSLGGRADLDGDGTTDIQCWQGAPTNGVDDDGDGLIDEDPLDGIDNDGDCAPGTDTDTDTIPCDFLDVGVDEDGGDSVGSRGEQAGTFMHEFGHALGLDHGGNDGVNNKPNYLSVMNYSFQMCNIPASPSTATGPIPGGCDYSRGRLDLNENSLDECAGLGAALGFGASDWDGDTFFEGATCPPPLNANVPFDVNTDGNTNTLFGFNDWAGINYDFRSSPFFSAGIAVPVNDEPDLREIEQARRDLSTRLKPAVTLTLNAPATAQPGDTVKVKVNATNDGTGPALSFDLDATLPDGSTVDLPVDALVAGQSSSHTVSFQVPADACPSSLTVSAHASFRDFAGQPLGTDGSTSVIVQDVTAPSITVTLSPDTLSPPNHTLRDITASVAASDSCDPAPELKLLSIASNEPDNGLGDGDIAGDIAGAQLGTDDQTFQLRSERSGGGTGRLYTITYQAIDDSGNAATAQTTVTVPK